MIKRYLQILGFGGTLITASWSVAAPVPENDWKLAGPFGGAATAIALDPKDVKILLAGGMNSVLYQSRDAGASWTLLNLPKRNLSEVTSILIDPADSNHYLVGLIAAEGGGLFDSADQGQTWKPVKDISNLGVRALTASASDASRFLAGTLRGAMLSTDSGRTWNRISDPNNEEMQGITAVAIDPTDPNVMYAGTTHLPWKTMDGGKTWGSIHTGMIDDSDVFSIWVDPAAPSNVFASACSGIYSSGDRGDQWRKLLGIPNTSRRTHVVRWENASCCGDSSAPGAVYAGTTTGLFRSLNRGSTWKTLTNTQVNALAFNQAEPSNLYLALEYEGLAKSSNGGETIKLINNGFVDRFLSTATVSGNRLVAIETQEGETTGIFVSGDRGESWSQLQGVRGLSGVHLTAITGLEAADKVLLAASPRQMYKSIDAGVTWKPLPIRLVIPPAPDPKPSTSQSTSPRSNRASLKGKQPIRRAARPTKPKEIIKEISLSEVSGLYPAKSGAKNLIFAATDLGLLKSADSGEHWMQSEIPGVTAVTALYVSPNFDGRLVARTAAGLYRSQDFGDHWERIEFPAPSDVNDVALSADPEAPLLIATRVGLYSPDNGGKWHINTSLPASTVTSVLYGGSTAPTSAYAVEYGRLYKSSDSGVSWKEQPTALPSLRIRQLWMPDHASERIYGITSDLGIIFRN